MVFTVITSSPCACLVFVFLSLDDGLDKACMHPNGSRKPFELGELPMQNEQRKNSGDIMHASR